MGGRGSSSGGAIKGIKITKNGTTLTYREHNGLITNINKTSKVNTNGMSLKQLYSRAKKQGFEIKTFNSKQLKEYDAKYKKEREKTSKQLDKEWYKAGPRPKHGMKGH